MTEARSIAREALRAAAEAPGPRLRDRPCASCGAPVEPLRAHALVASETALWVVCSAACRSALADRLERRSAPPALRDDGDRPRPAVSTTSPPEGVETSGRAAFEERDVPPTITPDTLRAELIALASAALVALATAAVGGLAASAAGAAACALGAWLAYRLAAREREDAHLVELAIGPASVVLLGVAAVFAPAPTASLLDAPLVSASVILIALAFRAWLDRRTVDRVRALLDRLTAPLPTTARQAESSSLDPLAASGRRVRTMELRAGEEVIVQSGERIPADGVIKAGAAHVQEHPFSTQFVARGPGAAVLAGAQVTSGAIRVLATHVGQGCVLSRPPTFGADSTRDASRVGRVGNSIASFGGVVALGLGVLAVVATTPGVTGSLVLVAAVLAAFPLTAIRRAAVAPFIAGAAVAAARGIAFRNARALDAAGTATVVALCSRGTLTEGRPEVVEFERIGDARDDTPDALLALAAAAESSASHHPLAQAILGFAKQRGVAPESVRRAAYLRGRGVTAVAPGGETLVLGNRQLLLDEGMSVAVADEAAARAETRGRTVLLLGLGGRVRAIVALEDTMRPGVRAAVQQLFDLPAEVVLLSGDHRASAEALATAVDIDHVKAELLPDERGDEVRRLRDAGGAVVAIGRPEEDDAPLAAADVPIVLGAAGSPSGERAVALATVDIRDAATALSIARATRRIGLGSVSLAAALSTAALACVLVLGAGPATAALLTLLADAVGLPAGVRVLRRFDAPAS